MSQTRQPIHVFPKITLKLGFWGRVTVILVIVTLIASYLLYYHGIRYKNREKAHYDELSGELQILKEQNIQSHTKNVILQQQVDQLQAQLGQVKTAIQPTQKQTWLIKQVAHYIHLAEQQLWLQHDSRSALLLLEIADQLLQDYANQPTLVLREAIAQDKLMLATNQQIDYAGTSLQLDALKKVLNQTVTVQKNNPVTQAPSQQQPQSAWQKGWQAFEQLISIQHYGTKNTPLLAQDQRWLIQQNAYLAVHQAQLALWLQQQARYQQSLDEVITLLEPYQSLHPQYATVVQQVQQLRTVNLSLAQNKLVHTPRVLATLAQAEPIPSEQAVPSVTP